LSFPIFINGLLFFYFLLENSSKLTRKMSLDHYLDDYEKLHQLIIFFQQSKSGASISVILPIQKSSFIFSNTLK